MLSILLIVTGASKGLGRSFSIEFVKKIISSKGEDVDTNNVLDVILISRNEEGLERTKLRIIDEAKKVSSKVTLDVSCRLMDLSDLDELENNSRFLFQQLSNSEYERAIFINNAGSVGPISKAWDLPSISSLKEMQKSIDFNVTSAMWLSSTFVSTFIGKIEYIDLINISSLCSIESFKTMGIYCSGKAARDMFHSTFAKELSESHENIRILNYAPGPCDTDMTSVLCESKDRLDEDLHKFYINGKKEKTLLSPPSSAKKLADLVFDGDFENGAHIDYYDLL